MSSVAEEQDSVAEEQGSVPEDSVSEDYVANKRFIWHGRTVLPGEYAPVSMLDHPRFETLISTGLIKAVRR